MDHGNSSIAAELLQLHGMNQGSELPCRFQIFAIMAVFTAGTLSGAMRSEEANRERLLDSYGKLPLQFELNQGQTNGAVKYLARGQAYTLFLTPDEAVISLHRRKDRGVETSANLRMHLLGARSNPALVGHDAMPGRVSYFRG